MQTPVPDHILDLVAHTAKNYIATKTDVLLKGVPARDHDATLRNSTHHLVESPARRDLHSAILQERVAHLPLERPDRPTILYLAGPMGVGKTTLLEEFAARIAEEEAGIHLGDYDDQGIENAYRCFKQIKQNLVISDFQYYKSRLPEYAASGNEYAVIRAEASGLDVALTQWATELKANLIIEQRGGRNLASHTENFSKGYNVALLGVTGEPALNAQRLAGRNTQTGQVIRVQELAKAICDFSAPDSFTNASKHARLAILLEANASGYASIYHAEQGREVSHRDEMAYARYQSYGNVSEAHMLARISPYFAAPSQEPQSPAPEL